jgi:hypothetical protein
VPEKIKHLDAGPRSGFPVPCMRSASRLGLVYRKTVNKPVRNGRKRDEEWPDVLDLEQNSQERDNLEGLAHGPIVPYPTLLEDRPKTPVRTEGLYT